MEPNLGYSKLLLLVLFLGSTSLVFLSHLASAATPKLNSEEVKALKEIGRKLGKKDWDFGVDPCSGKGNWNVFDVRKGFESSVICDCSFNHNSSCHVIRMYSSLTTLFSVSTNCCGSNPMP